MKNVLNWYVECTADQRKQLQAGIDIRYHNYGRINVWICARNKKIPANSLALSVENYLEPVIMERVVDYIHGFIQGAGLESSTKNLSIVRP